MIEVYVIVVDVIVPANGLRPMPTYDNVWLKPGSV
jgi:hypothetical protein